MRSPFTRDVSLTNMTAAPISPTVTGLIPVKAPSTYLLSLNLSMNPDTIIIIAKAGRHTPIVDTTAPGNPAKLNPTYVAAFTAIGPGVTWESATRSENSVDVITPNSWTL